MKLRALVGVCVGLFVWPSTAAAQPADATRYFGPVVFTRAAGKPTTKSVSIATDALEHFQGPFTLHLRNGAADASRRVSSASVSIGTPGAPAQAVFRPSDFSATVSELTAQVTITAGSVLSVQANSAPGSYLSIWIEGRLRPGRALIGPGGGAVTSEDGIATLTVPGDAVAKDVIFSVEAYSGVTDPHAVAGTAYELGPDGTEFNHPVVLTLAFDRRQVSEPKNLEIRTLSGGTWLSVEGSIPGQNAVSATLSHLSPYLVADTEFDAIDVILFETLQWIAEREQQFPLWAEPTLTRPYSVTGTPLYFIRRDANGAAMKAYLVDFPAPPGAAVEVLHAFPDVGVVYRYDAEMAELSALATFAFALDLSGRTTYAMAYNAHDMNRTPLTGTGIPYTSLDIWADLLVHEVFHHYQFHGPAADWVSHAFGGLQTASYPMTADNIALALLERRALVAGRAATTPAQRDDVLRRVRAIRTTRAQLPEAVRPRCRAATATKTHGQGATAPSGVGQSFTACETGVIRSITVDVLFTTSQNARLELKPAGDSWPSTYVQNIVLTVGQNVVPLATPFAVAAGATYSIGLFPASGSFSLWSDADSYPGGEAFFIVNSTDLGIAPSPDLLFDLTIEGPNYVDQMDRYQERNEGSAEHVARRLFVLSGTTAYGQERLEHLQRSMWTHYQTSRTELMSTVFQGGWYHTGSTILDLVNEDTSAGWRTPFPAGDTPIGILEARYGPMSQSIIQQLVDDAKVDYDWPSIVAQVNAIPLAYLDPP